MTYANEETQLRREKVMKMSAVGIPQRAIAQQTNVSITTVKRDIKYARLDIQRMLDSDYRQKLTQDMVMRFEQIYQEMWRLYASDDDARNKGFMLKSIGDLLHKQAQTMQSLGILPAAPVVNVQNTQQVVKLVWVDARKKEENK